MYTISVTPTRVPDFVPCNCRPCPPSPGPGPDPDPDPSLCQEGVFPDEITLDSNRRATYDWTQLNPMPVEDQAYGIRTPDGEFYPRFIFVHENGVPKIFAESQVLVTIPAGSKYECCQGFDVPIHFPAGQQFGTLYWGNALHFDFDTGFAIDNYTIFIIDTPAKNQVRRQYQPIIPEASMPELSIAPCTPFKFTRVR